MTNDRLTLAEIARERTEYSYRQWKRLAKRLGWDRYKTTPTSQYRIPAAEAMRVRITSDGDG